MIKIPSRILSTWSICFLQTYVLTNDFVFLVEMITLDVHGVPSGIPTLHQGAATGQGSGIRNFSGTARTCWYHEK